MAERTGAEFGAIVHAYIEADASTGAAGKRADALAAGLMADAERRQLLTIEHELEQAVLKQLGTAEARA